jgi:hypothetical protein
MQRLGLSHFGKKRLYGTVGIPAYPIEGED